MKIIEKIQLILDSIKIVLRKRNYALLALAAALAFIALTVFVQVFSVPGNTLEFWLAISEPWALTLMLVLSALFGILIAMNVFAFKQRQLKAKETGLGVAGGFSAFLATIFTSASCISCIGWLFGFLGTGTLFLILEHRIELTVAGIALIGISMYFVSKNISGKCRVC